MTRVLSQTFIYYVINLSTSTMYRMFQKYVYTLKYGILALSVFFVANLTTLFQSLRLYSDEWEYDSAFQRMWEESVVTWFKVLSWNFHGGTEESQEKPSQDSVGLIFEPGISRIRNRSVNHSSSRPRHSFLSVLLAYKILSELERMRLVNSRILILDVVFLNEQVG